MRIGAESEEYGANDITVLDEQIVVHTLGLNKKRTRAWVFAEVSAFVEVNGERYAFRAHVRIKEEKR